MGNETEQDYYFSAFFPWQCKIHVMFRFAVSKFVSSMDIPDDENDELQAYCHCKIIISISTIHDQVHQTLFRRLFNIGHDDFIYASATGTTVRNIGKWSHVTSGRHYNVWDEITYPSLNFNGTTVEVWEWISNFIPHFTG